MADLIQVRRDYAAQWALCNPILAQGEFGFELDTKLFKIGDGTTNWNSLEYWGPGYTGVQGCTGLGATGLEGPTGIQGPAGFTGGPGPSGDTGAPGVQGLTGADGLTGITSGATGVQGETGLGGVTGLANFVQSAYFSGPPDAVKPILLWSLTNEALYAGLTGPGDNWVQISAGAIGGPTGAAGAAGVGFTGLPGLPGAVGATGQRGATGLSAQYMLTAVGATGSSYAGSNTFAKAIDGNMSSRWESAASDPQWIIVDLGQQYNVGMVRLYWETASARDYTLDGSNNLSSWTNLYGVTGMPAGAGRIDQIEVGGASYRYVRMYGTARTTVYGYSIYEFQTFSTLPGSQGITGLSGTSNAYEGFAGMIEYPSNKTYVIDSDAPNAYHIDRFSARCYTGTCMAFLKINTTTVQPFGGVSISSTRYTGAATSAYSVAAGNRLTMGITGASSPTDLEFTIKTSRA